MNERGKGPSAKSLMRPARSVETLPPIVPREAVIPARLWRRHVRPRLRRYGWLLIGALWVVAVVLGYLGFQAGPGGSGSFWDKLYLALQLFPLQSGAVPPPVPWQLEVARLLAPAVLAATAVGAVLEALHDELQSLAVWRLHGHVVVCGLGERGLLLAKAFGRDYPVVAIEGDEEARGIGEAREEGVIVMIGDATDRTVLRKARVDRARYLVAVGGDDGTNAEVAVDARELVAGNRDSELDAFVHVVDQTLCRLLRGRRAAAAPDPFRLRFFNVFETGTRTWLDEHPPFGSADGRKGDYPPHLIVVGVGQLGTSLVVGAARSWLTRHPEAALRPAPGLRPSITLVDRAAEAKREALLARHPLLRDFCELVACEMDIRSPEFEQAAFLLGSEGRCTATSVYVCLDDDSGGLAAALTLMQRIGVERPAVPIVVRMRQNAGLATLLTGASGEGNLHGFALLDRTCTPQLLLGQTPSEIIARAIHEGYRSHALARGESPETNPSAVPWDELPEDLKESNRRQADHIAVKLEAVGCAIDPLVDGPATLLELAPREVEPMAELEHDRWAAERLFEGWTYAPGEKDLERKTSPYLVPWAELAEGVKELDRDTVRGLPAFLAQAGFRAVRTAPEASDA